ncbi:MAG: penicillin-insensitive murein endopeptidase [Candidatus Coatesbacteria bacterium]|nr:penicillin-insensitive murein endopeptidase [Candidatus Coatesbacteria bacterium]
MMYEKRTFILIRSFLIRAAIILMIFKFSTIEARKKEPETKKGYYQIKPGDNLIDISRKLGIPYSNLAKYNGSNIDGKLKPGTMIQYVKEEGKKKVVFLGSLRNGVQLTEGTGYVIRDKNRSWGTSWTIDLIKKNNAEFHKLHPEANPQLICDISYRRGGIMRGHITHQQGFDYDATIYRKGNPKYDRLVKTTPETIDARLCLDFINILVSTKRVKFILLDYSLQKPLYELAKQDGWPEKKLARVFQYPKSKKSTRSSIVRHRVGHADHFHIRYSEFPVDDKKFSGIEKEIEDEQDVEGETEDEEPDENQEDLSKQTMKYYNDSEVALKASPFIPEDFFKKLMEVFVKHST